MHFFRIRLLGLSLLSLLCCQIKGQLGYNKFLWDSTLSMNRVGWGSGIKCINDKAYISNWSWDNYNYNNPRSVNLYMLDDTGRSALKNSLLSSSIQYGVFSFNNSFEKNLDSTFSIFGVTQYMPNSFYKGFVLKYKQNLDTEFVRYYKPNGLADSLRCAIRGGLQLFDSSYIAFGWFNTNSTNTNSKLWTLRISKKGELIWEKDFGFSSSINDYSNICFFKNNILLSGGWFNHWGPSPWDKDYYTSFLIELDTSGNLLGHKDFTEPSISGGRLQMYKFNEEKLIVASRSDILNNPWSWGEYIGMLDTNYNFIWRNFYPDSIEYNPYVMKPLHDGNFLVVGARLDLSKQYYCGMINKYDSNGVMLWHRLYYLRDTCQNYLADFAETSTGDLICTGTVMGSISGSTITPQNVWILRTDSMGFISSTDSGFSDALGVIDISEDAIQDLKLFPNPAKNQLGLLYNIKETSQIYIYSINGQQVFQGKLDVTKHEDQIDVSLLIPGMYIIEIINPKGKVSKRFLKE